MCNKYRLLQHIYKSSVNMSVCYQKYWFHVLYNSSSQIALLWSAINFEKDPYSTGVLFGFPYSTGVLFGFPYSTGVLFEVVI